MTEWISVKDSLPEDKQEVIFKGPFPCPMKGFFEKTEKGYKFFFKTVNSKKIYEIYGTTHWSLIQNNQKEMNEC